MSTVRFAHVVNPVRIGPASDLSIAQPLTFASMRAARDHARRAGIDVALHCIHYQEDAGMAGDGFDALPFLTRSVLDCGTFRERRKLPLIGDILASLYEHSTADYFIYTDVDIGLMPYFYEAVSSLIGRGAEAFAINRRTVSTDIHAPADLPLIYAQLGGSHPGYDCFVFPRALVPRFWCGMTCIGVPLIGRVLLLNLVAHARKCEVLKESHLTFHLGDERTWQGDRYADYSAHNRREFEALIRRLEQAGPLSPHPLLPEIMAALHPAAAPAAVRAPWWRRASRRVRALLGH